MSTTLTTESTMHRRDELKTARIAGLAYLALGLRGMIGFLALRSQLYITGDPAATANNLAEKSTLAGLSVTFELVIVISQAVAALYFYKLFASVNRVAAVGILGFGLVNAAVILTSSIFMATAVEVAADASLAPAGDSVGTVGLLALLSTNAWAVGNVFFGLWLIPMGWVVITSGRMPKALGWFLIAGGIGYLAAAIVGQLWAGASEELLNALPLPATVGEFWMIGYLLVKGVRPALAPAAPAPAAAEVAR